MWQEILTQVIIYVVGLVISGVGAVIIRWVSNKNMDERKKNILCEALTIVDDGVKYVYQTYVDKLKGTTLWNEKAMAEAKKQAVDYIESHLSGEVVKYFNKNGEDIGNWIKDQIEINIHNNK